jgi:hypothetical protein
VAPALPYDAAEDVIRTPSQWEATVPLNPFVSSDAIYVALEALQCSPDEIAAALGIDVYALWGYYGGERHVPGFVLQRLTLLLHDRAALLRDLAALLGSHEVAPNISVIS